MLKYKFATDSQSGIIEADSWGDACQQLQEMVPSIAVDNGGWGWVEDDFGQRFAINSDSADSQAFILVFRPHQTRAWAESFDGDGSAAFHECNESDLSDLVQYCKQENIQLSLQWDARYEYSAFCEYWINGKYQRFNTDSGGDVVIPLYSLLETPDMKIADYVASLSIPVMDDFEIIECCQYCGGQCTDENGCDAHISNGSSALSANEKVD